MEYSDFYDIALYGNEAWKGSFTQKEIACNAYTYLCEFKTSKTNKKSTETIKELYRLLIEDGSDECFDWANMMAKEILGKNEV